MRSRFSPTMMPPLRLWIMRVHSPRPSLSSLVPAARKRTALKTTPFSVICLYLTRRSGHSGWTTRRWSMPWVKLTTELMALISPIRSLKPGSRAMAQQNQRKIEGSLSNPRGRRAFPEACSSITQHQSNRFHERTMTRSFGRKDTAGDVT